MLVRNTSNGVELVKSNLFRPQSWSSKNKKPATYAAGLFTIRFGEFYYHPCFAMPASIAANAFASFRSVVSLFPFPSCP